VSRSTRGKGFSYDPETYVAVNLAGEMRGCFGHRKPGGIEECLKNRLQKYPTEITSVTGSAS